MENDTTMPGLLTLPGALRDGARRQPLRFYALIFAVALLVLVLLLWAE